MRLQADCPAEEAGQFFLSAGYLTIGFCKELSGLKEIIERKENCKRY
jgi:hypothetical protein